METHLCFVAFACVSGCATPLATPVFVAPTFEGEHVIFSSPLSSQQSHQPCAEGEWDFVSPSVVKTCPRFRVKAPCDGCVVLEAEARKLKNKNRNLQEGIRKAQEDKLYNRSKAREMARKVGERLRVSVADREVRDVCLLCFVCVWYVVIVLMCVCAPRGKNHLNF